MKRNTTKQPRGEAGRGRAARRAQRLLPIDGMAGPVDEVHECLDIVLAASRSVCAGKTTKKHTYKE